MYPNLIGQRHHSQKNKSGLYAWAASYASFQLQVWWSSHGLIWSELSVERRYNQSYYQGQFGQSCQHPSWKESDQTIMTCLTDTNSIASRTEPSYGIHQHKWGWLDLFLLGISGNNLFSVDYSINQNHHVGTCSIILIIQTWQIACIHIVPYYIDQIRSEINPKPIKHRYPFPKQAYDSVRKTLEQFFCVAAAWRDLHFWRC